MFTQRCTSNGKNWITEKYNLTDSLAFRKCFREEGRRTVQSPLTMADAKESCRDVPGRQTLLQVSDSYGRQLLGVLRSFRERGLLFDFTIKVQEHTFPCHRCVLYACSDFFRAMFEADMRERDDGSVTLCDQSPAVLGSFLDFAYSGHILITEGNVDSLFQLASFLQVSLLSRACSDFLAATLDVANCLSLLNLAEAYGSVALRQSAADFVVRNFHELSDVRDFVDMQVDVLEECLRSAALGVPSEEAVVMSLLRWIRGDLPGRQKLLPGLLSLTRPHHLPPPALQTLLESDALLRSDESCVALLTEAQSRQSQHFGLFTDARPATTRTYIYVHKTEGNGETCHSFCYCVATDQWKELSMSHGVTAMPDPPGSHLTSFAEKVEFYDPLNRRWFPVSPLPTAVFYPEASACGNKIYTLGSQAERSDSFNPSLDCFFSYHAQHDQWSRLVADTGQFFHAALVKAVSIRQTLHLCDLSTHKLYSFCPETCAWKDKGSFGCAGFNAEAVGTWDKIYILGGDYSPNEITDEVQVYHSDRGQWEELSSMPRALTEFHCQLISFNRHSDPWCDL
ncbi:kelch repeat and BTB domain-containing protein 3-like isoform X3 [Entelurus aequoreus]|uniref:kelch repeat and BTB domain-containing protein 3-like isoform X3 n=1 Tax=Entelurus aequoreus TaxID=161455 RepID=UPI002B1D1D88|nr:kelch repeat and BTB domain-containing protein 3-like isoform X3 [Entelurus aequoreus]